MNQSRSESRMDELRKRGLEALSSHGNLREAWRELSESDMAEATRDDIGFLRSMIISRIYPVNAFELLVKIDPNAGVEVLLSRYLGRGVNPDTKFGGFESELQIMLDDLREVAGSQMIAQLVRNPDFAIQRIEDARVRRVLAQVLDMEEESIPDWVRKQRAMSM